MRYSSYGQMDGIPTNTSELYNDAGFFNEAEVEDKVIEVVDLSEAENGQFLSAVVEGTTRSLAWVNPPKGGFFSEIANLDLLNLTGSET